MNIEEIKELIEKKQFTKLKEELKEMKSADISTILDELDKEQAVIIFRLLSKEKAGMTFSYMETDMREKLIKDLTDTELKNVLDELFMDDTVDLIEEMPSNVVTRILRNVDKNDRKVINELLKYPEDSAGSIMTTEFIDLKENMTIEQALDRIRQIGTDSETIYTCYVLDKDRKLQGIISIKELILAKEESLIADNMETNIISVNTLEDKEEVAKKFDKYDLYALPVVDNENRLVGIVTVDDAINVLQDEAEEDFEKMAAMAPTEESYFETSVFKHAKNRIVWLLILMLSSAITGTIITNYENAFAAVPLLVAFIPMLMDTGGNCGSQSSTLIIRGLATDELEVKDVFKILWKEIRIAVIVGVSLALINGLRIFVQYKNLQLACTVGLSITVTVILSKSIGCLLPLLAKKLKLDPAIMAAPLITTIVDILSVLVYFNIATAIMGL
ncbi:MAG: magnesium transporter [Clostridium sp. 28_12]|nr:MAG: magnesium transporter [Clostridium sp. 28_12]